MLSAMAIVCIVTPGNRSRLVNINDNITESEIVSKAKQKIARLTTGERISHNYFSLFDGIKLAALAKSLLGVIERSRTGRW